MLLIQQVWIVGICRTLALGSHESPKPWTMEQRNDYRVDDGLGGSRQKPVYEVSGVFGHLWSLWLFLVKDPITDRVRDIFWAYLNSCWVARLLQSWCSLLQPNQCNPRIKCAKKRMIKGQSVGSATSSFCLPGVCSRPKDVSDCSQMNMNFLICEWHNCKMYADSKHVVQRKLPNTRIDSNS